MQNINTIATDNSNLPNTIIRLFLQLIFIVYILNNIESTLHRLLTSDKLFLLGGPCAIESEKITLETAEFLTKLTDKLGIPYVYKSSYRKS